jgi:hypothetical protein
MSKENPIIYFFIFYLIIIIMVHVGVSIWGDYKVNQLIKNSTPITIDQTGDINIDQVIQPLSDLGNNAKKMLYNTVVFIIGDLFTIIALMLPNFIREQINKWVDDGGYKELDWSTLNKYCIITGVINIVLIFIDIQSDFGKVSIYTNLIN